MEGKNKNYNPLEYEFDAEQAASNAEADKAKRFQELDDIKFLMSSAQGRRVLYRLLAIAGVHSTAFRVSGSRETDFTLGMQNFGYLLQAEVNVACPNFYLQMLREHNRG